MISSQESTKLIKVMKYGEEYIMWDNTKKYDDFAAFSLVVLKPQDSFKDEFEQSDKILLSVSQPSTRVCH